MVAGNVVVVFLATVELGLKLGSAFLVFTVQPSDLFLRKRAGFAAGLVAGLAVIDFIAAFAPLHTWLSRDVQAGEKTRVET